MDETVVRVKHHAVEWFCTRGREQAWVDLVGAVLTPSIPFQQSVSLFVVVHPAQPKNICSLKRSDTFIFLLLKQSIISTLPVAKRPYEKKNNRDKGYERRCWR